jgi:hypothetical protein
MQPELLYPRRSRFAPIIGKFETFCVENVVCERANFRPEVNPHGSTCQGYCGRDITKKLNILEYYNILKLNFFTMKFTKSTKIFQIANDTLCDCDPVPVFDPAPEWYAVCRNCAYRVPGPVGF